MMQLNFNASGVAPAGPREPLPTDWYPVMITASEEKPTKAGTGSYLELTLTVQGGEQAGRTVAWRLNLNNPNTTAVEIAYAELSAICHCIGRLAVQTSGELHGVPFQALIKKVERNDQPGTFGNEVAGCRDINGNEPGHAGTAGSQTAAAPNWAQGAAPTQQTEPPAQTPPDASQVQGVQVQEHAPVAGQQQTTAAPAAAPAGAPPWAGGQTAG